MEYASHAVGTAGLTTGIIGTSLGALNALGGLGNMAGLFGGNRNCNNEAAAAMLGAGLAGPYGWGCCPSIIIWPMYSPLASCLGFGTLTSPFLRRSLICRSPHHLQKMLSSSISLLQFLHTIVFICPPEPV